MATDPVGDLLTLLDIERLELDLFRGQSPDEEESQRVFGGQVIAQALVAAYRTVPDDRTCHSLHGYFIRPGDPKVPIIYQVDHSRDGGSFTTRRVVAIQQHRRILPRQRGLLQCWMRRRPRRWRRSWGRGCNSLRGYRRGRRPRLHKRSSYGSRRLII